MEDLSKRILITGITGFTGQFLANALRERGHTIQGLSRSDNGFITTKLDDLESLRAALAAFQPTHVVHLAGVSFPAHSVTSEIYDSNVSYTAKLLDALDVAKNLRQVIVVSSAAIYGQCISERPITEDAPASPVSHYALSKLFVEQMSALYSASRPILLVRPFNYIGVGQGEQFFVSKIVRAFIEKADKVVLGDLDVVRDFSDVRDVIDAYVRLIENDVVGETLNICSGVGTKLRDLIDYASELTGHTLDVQFSPQFIRPNEPRTIIGSDERLQQAIGPRAKHSLFETLKWIIEAKAKSKIA